MTDFTKFSTLIHAKFTEMSKGELFTTAAVPDDVYATYLASFPDGTNPIFRERTEHDCSCCRNFIKNIGNVVSIVDGKLISVWDVVGAEHPYDTVASALASYVKSFPVNGLFRSSERSYGAESSKELREGGYVHTWHHFHGKIANQHYSQSVGQVTGDYATTVGVFLRGLNELTPDAVETVLDLIASNSLYRGEEHRAAVTAFRSLQAAFLRLPEEDRNTFAWAFAGSHGARFRNTAIGTLVQDLSAGVDLEAAVKSFEQKVAPTNYKRPTALITPRMVQDAMATINQLGLEPSLERRFARISDVSVNNVLWVDQSVAPQMKGGLEGLLMGAATSPVAAHKAGKAEDITIDAFMANVVPQITSMDIVVRNSQLGNFMSLTAPVHDSKGIFKWNNDFAWSYDGNITDSLRQRVQSLGGRVDGVLRFSHTWNHEARNASLMDLHVFMPGSSEHRDGCHDTYPSGQRVGWNRRSDGTSGGVQDVDYTEAAPEGYIPVENITFPAYNRLREGTYTFKIHNWQLRQPTQGGFQAEIEFGGEVFQYDHPAPLKHKEWITLAVATLKDNKFTIQHKHPVGSAVQTKWGIQTETPIKVSTLMLSPNYWDDNAVGNKHWFFVLDGCKNDAPTRGIYNEFLSSNLDKHRKVFEVLGDKTKCQPTDDQLSGVGFSSTRGDSVVVNVTGPSLRKSYNITF